MKKDSFQLFGEVVLGLSQGSVSELLSKPKPWHMLSIKGREPFIRMQLWLNEPQSVDKLQLLKNERRDAGANKRKRPLGGSGGGSGLDSGSDRSSPADLGETYYASSVDSPGSAKKQRPLISEEQRVGLKVAFSLEPYPVPAVVEFLAQDLGLESRTVNNWFHNHRMRQKTEATPPVAAPAAVGMGSFDPVKFKLLCHQRNLELRQQQGGSDEASMPSEGGSVVSDFLRRLGLPLPPSAAAGGLDLTFKGSEEREDSIVASSDEGGGGSDNDEGRANATSPSSVSFPSSLMAASTGARSRRKPAAPQWVRPDYVVGGKGDEDDNDDVINGEDKDREQAGMASPPATSPSLNAK